MKELSRNVRGCGCVRAGEWKHCPFCGVAIPTKQSTRAALQAENDALKAELARLKKETAWLSTPKV